MRCGCAVVAVARLSFEISIPQLWRHTICWDTMWFWPIYAVLKWPLRRKSCLFDVLWICRKTDWNYLIGQLLSFSTIPNIDALLDSFSSFWSNTYKNCKQFDFPLINNKTVRWLLFRLKTKLQATELEPICTCTDVCKSNVNYLWNRCIINYTFTRILVHHFRWALFFSL